MEINFYLGVILNTLKQQISSYITNFLVNLEYFKCLNIFSLKIELSS